MTESFRLVMTHGPQPGQTFTLAKDLVGIGRDPANEIVINSPKISRQHARLVRRGDVVVLEDLGSTNGTYVNGMRLTAPHTLASGDAVGLGDAVTFTFYGQPPDADETLVGQPGGAPPLGYSPTARLPEPQAAFAAPPYEPAPTPYTPPATAPYTPPPPPAYTPSPPEPYTEPAKKSRVGLWLGCGCGLLLALAVLIAVLIYMDAYFPNILYAPLRWLGF